MKNIDYEYKTIESIEKSIHEGKWSNDDMMQLIEPIGGYFNMETLTIYTKRC